MISLTELKEKVNLRVICLTELKKRIKEEKETLNRYLRNDTSNRDERIFVNNDNSFSNDYDYEKSTNLISSKENINIKPITHHK